MTTYRRCPACQHTAAAGAFAVRPPPWLGWGRGGLLRRVCPACGHVGAETRRFPRVRAQGEVA